MVRYVSNVRNEPGLPFAKDDAATIQMPVDIGIPTTDLKAARSLRMGLHTEHCRSPDGYQNLGTRTEELAHDYITAWISRRSTQHAAKHTNPWRLNAIFALGLTMKLNDARQMK